MTVNFTREVIRDNGSSSFSPCNYKVYYDSQLVGQFEYYSEYAYFTFEDKSYKIGSKINFPLPIPLMKYVLTESLTKKQLGEFKRPFFISKRLKLTNQKEFELKKKGITPDIRSILLLSNKDNTITYHYPSNCYDQDAYRKNMAGTVETNSSNDLLVLFSGFYLIEKELGNFDSYTEY